MFRPLAKTISATLLALAALPSAGEQMDRIAFVSNRDGNNEAYVMAPDGSGQTNLTNGPWEDRSPTWSPDARRIAFASDREGSYDLFVMDADGSNVVRLDYRPGCRGGPFMVAGWRDDHLRL